MDKSNDYCSLISIIIPVYNVEKYISQCIESVANQTYTNIEIILIDDGSTDTSGTICDNYAENDSRIIVIHKENEGPSAARNLGVDIARGEYIMFVDSDDWVDLTICEKLLSACIKYNTCSAMCAYVREYPKASLPKCLYEDHKIFTCREVQRILCGPLGDEVKNPENIECFNSLCGKLYPAYALKRSKMVDLRVVGTSEDLIYNMEVFSFIKNLVYIDFLGYHYRKEVTGSVTACYKSDLSLKWNYLFDHIYSFIKSNGLPDEMFVALNNRIAISTIGLGLNCVSDDASIFVKFKRVKNIISDTRRREALKSLPLSNMPIYWKIFFLCARNRWSVCLCILLIIIKYLKGKV